MHDSYWTHASDYGLLAKVLREQFVNLYSLPVLANLKASIERECVKLNHIGVGG